MLYYARAVYKGITNEGDIVIVHYGYNDNPGIKQELAYGILMTLPMKATPFNSDIIVHTFKEYLEYLGYDLSGIKWMTKEEFYNLEA